MRKIIIFDVLYPIYMYVGLYIIINNINRVKMRICGAEE